MSEIDIVLIDPPAMFNKPAKNRGAKQKSLPHLGLLNVAAVLEKAGYSVKYIDSKVQGLGVDESCDEALWYKPRYIGITATTPVINYAAKVADRLKEKCDATIIVGGTHITGAPVKTMKTFKSFDIGVVKEGEITVLELLEAIDKGRDLNNINGLVYRDGEKVILTENRDYITDLNSLPFPAWHLLPDLATHYQPNYMSTRRLPSNHIITSRGCYGRCIFCDKSVTGHKVRTFSIEYVMEMFDILHNKYGIRDIQINDDSFVNLKKRAHRICDELIKQKWDLTWSCDARVDNIDRELMQKIKAAGCWQISFGIESGSQRILDFIKKNITLEQVENAVNLAKEAGLNVKGFFILGHPTETKESIMQTVEFISKLHIDDFGLTFFTPYPGSPFYEMASQYGHFKDSWDTMQGYCIDSFVPEGFTQEELIAYRKLAHTKFYLRPGVIFSKLRDIRTPFDLLKFTRGVISFSRRFQSSSVLPSKRVVKK